MDEVASRGGVQKYALCYTQLRTALRNLSVRRDILYIWPTLNYVSYQC
jgi:hypothetical protein